MKEYFVVFNVPIALGNGDNGFVVRATNKKQARKMALRECLKTYKPKYVEAHSLTKEG
jgi:hypothetical protein